MDAKFWSNFLNLVDEEVVETTDLERIGPEVVELGQIIERLRQELRRRQAAPQRRLNAADTRQDS